MPFTGSSPQSSHIRSVASTVAGPGVLSPPTPRRPSVAPRHATWTAFSPERGSKNSNTNTCADAYPDPRRFDARSCGHKEVFHALGSSGNDGRGGTGHHVPDPGLPGSGGCHRLVVPGLQLPAAGDHAG